VAQAPDLAAAYALRPRLLNARGRVREALRDWEKLAELRPKAPTWPNNAAWVLLTGPASLRAPDRGLQLALRAVALDGQNHLYLNTLGVAQYRNGLYRDAVRTLEASLVASRGQSDGFDLFFLAMSHRRLGDAAKACFDQAARWCDSRQGLAAAQARELRAFRAEAEQALGLQ
jgi:tetratricopeptide (TPR) repeat protein